MKSTVLNAHPATAEKVATDLISRKGKKGQHLFTRHDIPDGFEIRGVLKGEAVVLFRYTHPDGRHRFDYDERFLSFK